MISLKEWTAAALFAATLLGPQAAFADDLGAQAIAERDWQTAEQQILAGLEQNPGDVFRLLNLAAVYGQTGRKEEAATIYQQILESDSDRVAALSTGRERPVRAVAERGLEILTETP